MLALEKYTFHVERIKGSENKRTDWWASWYGIIHTVAQKRMDDEREKMGHSTMSRLFPFVIHMLLRK